MGHIPSQVRSRGSFAAAALLAVALAACSGPVPAGLPSSTAGANPATSSPATSSQPPSSTGASPATTPGGGEVGGFGTIAEACGAVSATVLSVLVLPMAAATGKDTADVEKAKEALANMQGRVPAELKDSFDKLKSIAEDAGQDFSRFNTEEFDQPIAPIDAWLQANC
ncbi:hypothetical protein BJG92_02557 [Arthrobacter sp. SO5]|uniref:hypothetical protein n=1 Tax=Arthrobacter sp. SO5 TaxID=1897055 RepID=UPI001E52FB36|nr:hypothetical protein [Arthrobacter sp. SO5]MCB5275016.1 hypothetical protein [Arthrobacter sp. SO5]